MIIHFSYIQTIGEEPKEVLAWFRLEPFGQQGWQWTSDNRVWARTGMDGRGLYYSHRLIFPPFSLPRDPRQALLRLAQAIVPQQKTINKDFPYHFEPSTEAEARADLAILQGHVDGDSYHAANRLAAYWAQRGEDDEGLTDWLAEGDYDGRETLEDIILEWQSIKGD